LEDIAEETGREGGGIGAATYYLERTETDSALLIIIQKTKNHTKQPD
jgi:hypothetical protein